MPWEFPHYFVKNSLGIPIAISKFEIVIFGVMWIISGIAHYGEVQSIYRVNQNDLCIAIHILYYQKLLNHGKIMSVFKANYFLSSNSTEKRPTQ